MSFSFFRCCRETCVRDPNKMYELGMEYVRKYKAHPLHGVEEPPSSEEYNKYSYFFRKAYKFLEEASEAGHSEATFQLGKWMKDEHPHSGDGMLFIEKAADKGHLLAKQIIIDQKRVQLDREQKELQEELRVWHS